ncbi:AI-2E family transporter [Clostridium intestinale]|uniref:AI-2E family transporter n=1 Tax=Clostridium intestinale TaxID=36845 RepID=UPI002DD66259|nr:AI-2E family transporter [Clostridium intestinale]WRY50639.1 AI-2E family transporter [Clostridium intestinale]
MNKKNILINLLIYNLVLLLIILFSKTPLLIILIKKLLIAIFLPIVIGAFLYYLIRPLRNIFLKKGFKIRFSIFLSLLISCLVFALLVSSISRSLVNQVYLLIDRVSYSIKNFDLTKFNDINAWLENYIDIDNIKSSLLQQSQNYIYKIGSIFKIVLDFGWNLFANVILFLLITYHLLKDDKKFKKSLSNLPFIKNHSKAETIINKADDALFSYITGQASVAFCLAVLVFIGYWILNFPGKLIFAISTFILAFIPFLGFFISMIIPYIIALTLGIPMIIKLTIVFMIAQTIKGRFVVPLIMSRAMKIHPLTDIFLVIGAATLFGIPGAFLVVPIYAILKIIWENREIDLDKS